MRAVLVVAVLALLATPGPAMASRSTGTGSLNFDVGTVECRNSTATIPLSAVTVSVLYLNSSNGTIGNYTWGSHGSHPEDPGLEGGMDILLHANPPSVCPWAGGAWLNWSDASPGDHLRVNLTFIPRANTSVEDNGTGGIAPGVPPAPIFPLFLQLTGLGIFGILILWGLRGWFKLTDQVSGGGGP